MIFQTYLVMGSEEGSGAFFADLGPEAWLPALLAFRFYNEDSFNNIGWGNERIEKGME